MKLSNKFALISSVVSFIIGIPLVFSFIMWTIPMEYNRNFFYSILAISLSLICFFYFYQEFRLKKAIANNDERTLLYTPLLSAIHASLNFSVLIFISILILNPLLKLTTTTNILKIGLLTLPIGLIELSFIYYLSLLLLMPYYKNLENTRIKNLNISQQILLLTIPAIIFSGFTGYIITKSWNGLIYLLFPALTVWILIKIIKYPVTYLQQRIEHMTNDSLTIPKKRIVLLGEEMSSINEALSLFLEKTVSSISNIKDTADNVRTQGEAILSGIQRISSSSKQIDHSAHEFLSNKEESQSSISSVNKSNDGLSSLSSEIESQIKTLLNTSKKSIELANSGEQKSEEGVNKINDFVQKIEEGSKSLEELSSAFEEIKEFNSLMEQISDDTNLLALNASIEATRKEGEESKGFSVIADEIRKLSNDSTSYLEKTKENIKRMSEAVKSIVESTEKSISIFEESKSIIQKTAEDLKEISESIGMTTNMADQISGILQESSTATNEIKKSTKKLSLLNEKQVDAALSLSKETEEQVASMEETETRVHTLISLIDKIKESANIKIE